MFQKGSLQRDSDSTVSMVQVPMPKYTVHELAFSVRADKVFNYVPWNRTDSYQLVERNIECGGWGQNEDGIDAGLDQFRWTR